jgi:hypothetical protein
VAIWLVLSLLYWLAQTYFATYWNTHHLILVQKLVYWMYVTCKILTSWIAGLCTAWQGEWAAVSGHQAPFVLNKAFQCEIWGCHSSGLTVPDILKEHSAFIFRAKQAWNHVTIKAMALWSFGTMVTSHPTIERNITKYSTPQHHTDFMSRHRQVQHAIKYLWHKNPEIWHKTWMKPGRMEKKSTWKKKKKKIYEKYNMSVGTTEVLTK